PATAVRADLAPGAVLGDRRDVEPRQGPGVADRPARGGRDQHDDLFAGDRGDYLLDARVGGARLGVDALEQIELAREIGRDGRPGQRIEIVRAPSRSERDHAGGAAAVGDGARAARGLVEVLDRYLVGLGVARPRPRLGPDSPPLA